VAHFWDMHSGGRLKESPYHHIYIEAYEEEAMTIFYNRFGHNPRRITCTCCGSDYGISNHEDIAQLTGFQRGCRNLVTPQDKNGLYKNDDPVIKAHLWLEEGEETPLGYKVDTDFPSLHGYMTLDKYKDEEDVLFIYTHEIKDRERHGTVPEQGYVWVD